MKGSKKPALYYYNEQKKGLKRDTNVSVSVFQLHMKKGTRLPITLMDGIKRKIN